MSGKARTRAIQPAFLLKCKAVEDLVAEGVSVKRACERAGIARPTFYEIREQARIENEMGRRSDTAIRPDLTTPLREAESLPEAPCGEDRSA